jgi:hypothetical protein
VRDAVVVAKECHVGRQVFEFSERHRRLVFHEKHNVFELVSKFLRYRPRKLLRN